MSRRWIWPLIAVAAAAIMGVTYVVVPQLPVAKIDGASYFRLSDGTPVALVRARKRWIRQPLPCLELVDLRTGRVIARSMLAPHCFRADATRLWCRDEHDALELRELATLKRLDPDPALARPSSAPPVPRGVPPRLDALAATLRTAEVLDGGRARLALSAVKDDGTVLWTVKDEPGALDAAEVFGDTLYATVIGGERGYLIAIDVHSGAVLWRW